MVFIIIGTRHSFKRANINHAVRFKIKLLVLTWPARKVNILCYLSQREKGNKEHCYTVSFKRRIFQEDLRKPLFITLPASWNFQNKPAKALPPLRKALQISLSKGFILIDGSEVSPKDKPYGSLARFRLHRISTLPRNSSLETKLQSRIFRKRGIFQS